MDSRLFTRLGTLRQLEIFAKVAEHGSMARAAEELFLTQPAVSMQIRQLEDNVGLPLFEQLGKRLFITDAGREQNSAVEAGDIDLIRTRRAMSNQRVVDA